MGIADRAMRALLIVGGLNWLMVAAGGSISWPR